MRCSRIDLTGIAAAVWLLTGPASAQTSAPPVEQDCARGETAHEVFTRDNFGGGTFGYRLHFCVKNPAHGVQVFQQARTQVTRDPYLTVAMRTSLLRQIDAKIALFEGGGGN